MTDTTQVVVASSCHASGATQSRRAEFVGLFGCALTLALARTVAHARMVDICFDDEVGYLRAGLTLLRAKPPTAEWSPVYASWYWIESLFIREPLTLYDANWGVLLFATLLALWAALKTIDVSAAGVVLAMSLASMLYYFEVWPHVYLLSGALVLVASAFALKRSSSSRAFSRAAAIIAVATFVRPELVGALVVCLAITVCASVRDHQYRAVILPGVVVAMLIVLFGVPFGGGRSMNAFGQHYAFGIARLRHIEIDPWNNWEWFVRADFGDVSTPFAAFLANPGAFAHHVATNGRNLFKSSYLLMPYLASSNGVGLVLWTVLAIPFVIGIFWAIRISLCDKRALRQILLSGALAIPWCLSSLMVWPRPRYFVAAFTALSILAAFGLIQRLHFRKGRSWMFGALPLVLLIIGLTAASAVSPLPNRATVQFLRSLSPRTGGMILEPDLGRAVLAGLAHERLSQRECTPFDRCLGSWRPDLVVSDERLRAHYRRDEGFRDFADSPGKFGYDDKLVPQTSIHVYVRKSAANGNPTATATF